MDSACGNLDDYLAGDLPASEAERFSAHAESCAECRAAVDEQRWIDGLLTSPVRAELESASPKLVQSIEAAVAKSSQRARMFTVGLAAAAACLLAVGWTALMSRKQSDVMHLNADSVIEIVQPEPTAVVDSPPRAIVDGGADMLVVPIESPYPQVTIVRVYATFQLERAELADASPFPADEPDEFDEFDEFAWPDEIYGETL